MTNQTSQLTWRKSSYSGHGGGECVEIAPTDTGIVATRDSKNPTGPTLRFRAGQWTAFLGVIS
jgi:hypothetical protein